MTVRNAKVEYIRPGKETTYYIEDFVFENEDYLKTFKRLPEDAVARLTHNLLAQGLIRPGQRCGCITKFYFFHENFNLLLFQDEQEGILGYYSDIGTPLIRTGDGYQMTDWFLDIWLSPDGTLFELDIDEFEEALSKDLLPSADADLARETFERLIREVKQGIYPNAYLR